MRTLPAMRSPTSDDEIGHIDQRSLRMIRAPTASPRHDPVGHRAAEEQATTQSAGNGVSVDAPGGSRTVRTPSDSERLCRSVGLADRTCRETRGLANVA